MIREKKILFAKKQTNQICRGKSGRGAEQRDAMHPRTMKRLKGEGCSKKGVRNCRHWAKDQAQKGKGGNRK